LSEVPEGLRYTKEHEWARSEDDVIVVGITDYAQDQLGDVVFVGLPDVGNEVAAGEPCGEVESTKSVSDIYSPVTGEVIERNDELEQNPELINSDPYRQGWLFKVRSAGDGGAGLMAPADYQKLIEES
jgi:glycine cleavage system H protein